MNRRPQVCAVLLAALSVAAPAAQGQEDEELAAASKPLSSVSGGIGLVNRDGARFGQYSGLNERGGYALLDFYLSRRNDATGHWLEFSGRNLGLDSRELRLDHRQQGNWRYFIDFSQTPRFSPYTVSTTLAGIDTSTQVEGGTARRDVQLETRRDALSFGFDKQLGRGFDLSLRFRNEDKSGTRLWGHHSVRFLVDPIDYRTQQWEAMLGYTGDRLQLSGGYNGSSFTNQLSFVQTPVGGGLTPIALPPGNESHQFSLAGGYNITPTARATFKVAYARATQNDTFFLAPIASVPRTDLGGRIDTTQVQLGLTARPLPKLTLRANLRHEDRDDRTPVHVYTVFAAGTTSDGTNEPRSHTITTGKFEASYALPMGFRLTGGADLEHRKRNTSAIRAVSFRDNTDESTARVELRRSLSETLNGALSVVSSRRDGSDWYTNVRTGVGNVGSNLIHPLHLADRDRDKVRLVLDWAPLEPLTVNFSLDGSSDSYSGRALGPRKGSAQHYSVDAAYSFSEKWQATAWFSRNDTKAEQETCESASTSGVCPNSAADPLWSAQLRNVGDAVGIGMRGKPSTDLSIGADLTHARDRGEFRQTPLRAGVAAATVPAIPDVNYRRTSLNLFGSYALNKQASVRLQYVLERFRTDDWYWTDFVYGDGTTVSQNPNQTVQFIGASYRYEFR